MITKSICPGRCPNCPAASARSLHYHLVLAMLLFKPAPMYILDEVDAALDLSHTQNIGVMLRAHFKASQFIVVSLKEGMFNNANVVFRTKFVDGVSTVRGRRRTTTRRRSARRSKVRLSSSPGA